MRSTSSPFGILNARMVDRKNKMLRKTFRNMVKSGKHNNARARQTFGSEDLNLYTMRQGGRTAKSILKGNDGILASLLSWTARLETNVSKIDDFPIA